MTGGRESTDSSSLSPGSLRVRRGARLFAVEQVDAVDGFNWHGERDDSQPAMRLRTRSDPPWGANIPSAGQAALRRPVGPSRARSSEASIARLGRTKRSEDPADMTKSARTKGIAVFV